MEVIKVPYTRFKTLRGAIQAYKKVGAHENQVALAYPLDKLPSLLELKIMGEVRGIEMGVDYGLAGDDHLVIFGNEKMIQFPEDAGGNRFKVHSHLDDFCLPSFNDANACHHLQAVVTDKGVGFAETIGAVFGYTYKLTGQNILSGYRGCPGIGEREYVFLADPTRKITEDVEGAVAYCARFGYDKDIINLFRREQYASIAFVCDDSESVSMLYWFYNWTDIQQLLCLNLNTDGIPQLLNIIRKKRGM